MARVTHSYIANSDWSINKNDDGTYPLEQVKLAVLMDIRDELHRLNSLFRCTNFLNMPQDLKKLRIATERKKRKKAKPCPQ